MRSRKSPMTPLAAVVAGLLGGAAGTATTFWLLTNKGMISHG
jgi:hypothetical protein